MNLEAFEVFHIESIKMIRSIFKYADPLYGSMPIYPSGYWSWTFASIEQPIYINPIPARANKISKGCKIWSPRWQKGSFNAIPSNLERKLKQ